ncbi:MAG: enoyl-CoA hydratase, partial [Deltaproteobacteria bacterium]|nr:enoyl-CoA hydratase [Deltaproteobacteria bacterium]
MNDSILFKKEKNGIVTLTLNRTEVMNSFNFALLLALKAEIEDLQFSTDVRV